MKEELYQIILTYVCANIIIQNGIVIKTAPIFNWMMGKNLIEVQFWVYNKNGVINKITQKSIKEKDIKNEIEKILNSKK